MKLDMKKIRTTVDRIKGYSHKYIDLKHTYILCNKEKMKKVRITEKMISGISVLRLEASKDGADWFTLYERDVETEKD